MKLDEYPGGGYFLRPDGQCYIKCQRCRRSVTTSDEWPAGNLATDRQRFAALRIAYREHAAECGAAE